MRYLFLIIAIVTIVSCKNEKSTSKAKVVETKTVSKVPVINYDELELLLSAKDDKTYIVNFWATWCKPCVEELPYFEEIYKNYKDENVELILVSLDFTKQIEKRVLPFIKEHNLQGKVVVMGDPDQNTWIPKVDSSWSGAIPATVIYNRNNRQFYEGSYSYEKLESELLKILK